jgi:ribosome-associated toxin RatA of RatAB toxin-antitoxin module
MAMIQFPSTFSDLPDMPEFDKAQQRSLDRGKIIKKHEKTTDADGFRGGSGFAYMILEHPPKTVWDQILDFENYHTFFKSVFRCRIYDQHDNEIFAQFILKIGMIIKVTYHIHHTVFPEKSRMTWVMDNEKKNDFKNSHGIWTVWPLEHGRSLVSYSITLESGRSIPKIIEDVTAKSGLKKVMESLKKRVAKKAQ